MPCIIRHPLDPSKSAVFEEGWHTEASGASVPRVWPHRDCKRVWCLAFHAWVRDDSKATVFPDAEAAHEALAINREVAENPLAFDHKIPRKLFGAFPDEAWPLSFFEADERCEQAALWALCAWSPQDRCAMFVGNDGRLSAKEIGRARLFPSEAAAREKALSLARPPRSVDDFAFARVQLSLSGVDFGPSAPPELKRALEPAAARAEQAAIERDLSVPLPRSSRPSL